MEELEVSQPPEGGQGGQDGPREKGLGGLPSTSRQKTFIVENAAVLNRERKLAILSLVMMEVGPSVVVETGGAREVDIDLDGVAAQNAEVLGQVYNIVRAWIETLGQPARHGCGAGAGFAAPDRPRT